MQSESSDYKEEIWQSGGTDLKCVKQALQELISCVQ